MYRPEAPPRDEDLDELLEERRLLLLSDLLEDLDCPRDLDLERPRERLRLRRLLDETAFEAALSTAQLGHMSCITFHPPPCNNDFFFANLIEGCV